MTTKHPICEAKTSAANRQIGELLGLGFYEHELHFILDDDGVTELVASDKDSILGFLRRTRLPLHVAKVVADYCHIPLTLDDEAAIIANEETSI